MAASHNQQLALAGTALTTATLSLVLSYFLLHRPTSTAAAAAQDATKPDSSSDDDKDKDKDDDDDKDKKRYETKREFYSPQTGIWETREVNDEDKNEFLFRVLDRKWPKSKDYEGHEDYVAIEVTSQPLVDCLRVVLKEVEEMFNDEPSLDSQDLFLHQKELKALLETKKAEKLVLEAKKEAETTKSDDGKDGEKDSKDKETVETVKEDVTPFSEKSTTDVAASEVETVVENKQDDDATASPAPAESKEVVPTIGDDHDDSLNLAVPDTPQTLEQLSLEVDHLDVLLTFIEELFAPVHSKLERFLKEGQISFNLLWAVFPPDCSVVTTECDSGEKMAFRLKSSSYTQTRDGPVFQLSGVKLIWNGTRYARTWVDANIPKFKGMRKIAALSSHPLTSDKQREDLTARGRTYCELAGVKFLNYNGVLIQVIGSGFERRVIKLRAEGRAVVDVRSYRRLNPSRASGNMWDDDMDDFDNEDHSNGSLGTEVAEEDLHLLPPTVFGFSLIAREWGEMLVHLFNPIEFRTDAYSHLVLDPNVKDLIRSLVQQNNTISRARAIEAGTTAAEGLNEAGHSSEEKAAENAKGVVTDVIAGKGGGLVIVLHGRPGVGKTLTAEAVAELLRAPLYSVTAGELGVQADQLEKRLRDTLDIAQTWGSVLLIDYVLFLLEADVFLETRSLHDVARNAMVSVFLRLLEYHSGVLFLTTNRIRTVDEAFLSRFSIAVTYPDLDKAKRRTIWKSFLALAGVGIEGEKLSNGDVPHIVEEGSKDDKIPEIKSYVSSKYLDRLAAKTGFNGRSIKNTVRTAQALAMSHDRPLSETELDLVVKTSEQFAQDFKEADEGEVYEVRGERSHMSVYN